VEAVGTASSLADAVPFAVGITLSVKLEALIRDAGDGPQPFFPSRSRTAGTTSMSNPLTDRRHPLYPKFNYMTEEEYDAWFCEHVEESLDDDRPLIPHEEVVAEMKALIAKRKSNPRPVRWRLRQQAFGEGYFAFTAHAPIDDNPHDERKSKSRSRWWRQGWLYAQRIRTKQR
jgi:hypothetical protein